MPLNSYYFNQLQHRSENTFASMKYSFFLKKDYKNKDGKTLFTLIYISRESGFR